MVVNWLSLRSDGPKPHDGSKELIWSCDSATVIECPVPSERRYSLGGGLLQPTSYLPWSDSSENECWTQYSLVVLFADESRCVSSDESLSACVRYWLIVMILQSCTMSCNTQCNSVYCTVRILSVWLFSWHNDFIDVEWMLNVRFNLILLYLVKYNVIQLTLCMYIHVVVTAYRRISTL
jgi:hypothetical protein